VIGKTWGLNMAVVVPGDYIALIINTITACYKIVLSNLSINE